MLIHFFRSISKELNFALFKLIINSFKKKISIVKELKKHKELNSNEVNNESYVNGENLLQNDIIITQNNALQMIFDLKYLNLLFELKDDTTGVNDDS